MIVGLIFSVFVNGKTYLPPALCAACCFAPSVRVPASSLVRQANSRESADHSSSEIRCPASCLMQQAAVAGASSAGDASSPAA